MAVVQTESATSKELILRRMNSEKGHAHFTTWKKFEQLKAIADCGLAKHRYQNKLKRNEVLKHLFSADLPLSDDKVKQILKNRKILCRKGQSSQQLAGILLTHLAPGLTPAPEPVPVRSIIPTPRQLVANQAKIVCWSRISGIEYVPYIYGDPGKAHLWQPRRKVTGNLFVRVRV